MTEEERLFHAALANSPAERASFLDQACAGNAPLRAAVEALLAAHDAPGSLLNLRSTPEANSPGASPLKANSPASDLAATLDSRLAAEGEHTSAREHPSHSDDAREARPSQTATADFRRDSLADMVIGGRYTLQEKIGEGGMGEVWVAKQTEPVKRKVALKLIKRGMDSRAVLLRFEQERQALALMDHPHIARVFDGGITPGGQPFFVMELVNGLPLNRFCDQASLTPQARLELFVPICQAVQHAHQKGIVHRDLKPANILVTMIDGKPVPKVIDFGVAKATAGKLTEETMSTGFGAVVGTLEYMSPEQAGFSGEDIDTRADIYSLGVILYELLTGLRPIDAKRLRKAALTEMIRIIREEEPSKPSTRLSTDESLPSLAAVRQIEPRKLTALLRGELDWVVMKCLEKSRDRRYETANALARDVQRFLADEPVEARPASAGYRLSKFVRRNRAQVIAAGLLGLSLIGGIIGTSFGLWRASLAAEAERLAKFDAQNKQAEAESQRRQAEAARTEAERQESEAKRQAAIAEAVAKFQTRMLAAVDPSRLPVDPVTKKPLKDAVTVVQALAAAVKVLDQGELRDQPLVEAGVRSTIGKTLHELARFQEAEPNMRKALALRRMALPAGHPDIAKELNNLAGLLHDLNQLAEAESLYREALQIERDVRPVNPVNLVRVMNNLGVLLEDERKFDEAEQLNREALEFGRKHLPANDDLIALVLNARAVRLLATNQLAEAEQVFRESLAIYCETRPAGHPDTARSLENLATVLQDQRKYDEAEACFREALQTRRKVYPDGHPDIATSLDNLAKLLLVQKRLADAEPLMRESLEIRRKAFPPGHPDIALGLNNLASILEAQKKYDEAEPLYRESLAINRKNLPARHPHIITVVRNLANFFALQGKTDDALPLLKELLASLRATLPKESAELAAELSWIARHLLTLKAWSEAETVLKDCLAIREQMQPDMWTTFNTESMLGGALLGQKRYSEAEPLLLAGFEGMKARAKSIPPQGALRMPEALERLIELYTATEQPDEVTKWRTERAKYPPGGAAPTDAKKQP